MAHLFQLLNTGQGTLSMSLRSNKKGIGCIGFTEKTLNYARESPVQFMKDRRGLFGLSHYLAQYAVKLTIAKYFSACRQYEISCEEVLNVFSISNGKMCITAEIALDCHQSM